MHPAAAAGLLWTAGRSEVHSRHTRAVTRISSILIWIHVQSYGNLMRLPRSRSCHGLTHLACDTLQYLDFGMLPFERRCRRQVELTNMAPFSISVSWQLPELLPMSPGPGDRAEAHMQPPILLVSPMEAILGPHEQLSASVTLSTGG